MTIRMAAGCHRSSYNVTLLRGDAVRRGYKRLFGLPGLHEGHGALQLRQPAGRGD